MTTQRHEPAPTAERLSELLLRWRELREADGVPPVEELCADCPELAEELRRQIRAIASMEAVLGIGRDTTDEPDGLDHSTPRPARGVLPTGLGAAEHPSIPNYEIEGVIDQGGMGIVYKAHQIKPGRAVAIKMIPAGPRANRECLARFHREAEALAKIRHPNVVQIFEVGEWAGQPYYVMEYLEEGTLAQKLGKTVVPARPAADLIETLARAVHAAHEHGIIHRDLKPGNVLLTRKSEVGSRKSAVGSQMEDAGAGPNSDFRIPTSEFESLADFEPKITDFGLAKLLSADGSQAEDQGQTRTGAIMGTASYMAPEQVEGKAGTITPATDVYALGAILYELLTGRPPFQGETTLDTLEQVRTQEPVAPSRLHPRVSRDLETVCLKCLEKDPRRRYSQALDLAADLRRFQGGEPVRARRTPAWERAVKWARRKPALAGLLGVSAAAVVAFLALWIGFTTELREAKDRAERQRDEARTQRDAANAQRERAQAILRRLLARVDDDAEFAVQGKAETRATWETGSPLYVLARGYAAASGTYRNDPLLPPEDREQLAEQFASRAVKLLQKVRDSGFFARPRNRERLKNDQDFDPLRSRADFQRLRADIEGS